MSEIKITEVLTYDDVLLVPQYSDIKSRGQVNLTSDMGKGVVLSIPIISSPMDTVTGRDMAFSMDNLGGLGIVHRYNSIEEQSGIISSCKLENARNIGAAVGVTGDYLDRALAAKDAGANLICVDVAHGHHILVGEALSELRMTLGLDFHIMAGNVATAEGFDFLAEAGADSVRCNIGGGSICTTRIQTGHGVPGLHTIFDCASSKYAGQVKIIADGGIRNSGDIVKAYAAGADYVMLGSLLAGTTESCGELVYSYSAVTGKRESRKVYRGMASKEAQFDWRGRTSSLEGVSSSVPYKGDLEEIISTLEGGIRSGLSYSGSVSIPELHMKAQFIRQTVAGRVESNAHIRLGE